MLKSKKMVSLLLSLCMMVTLINGNAFAMDGNVNNEQNKNVAVSENKNEPDQEIVTRVQWLKELIDVFDISSKKENYPDNYYSDIDSTYENYDTIMLATQVGLIDVKLGEEVNPDKAVTREFAAHTLNYCLGFLKKSDNYEYSESGNVDYADDLQVAIERGWFLIVRGKINPNSAITVFEKQVMLEDAKKVVNNSKRTNTSNNGYTLKSGVKEIPNTVSVEMIDDDVYRINSTKIVLKSGDIFVSSSYGIPFARKVVSVSNNNGYIKVKTVKVNEDEVFDDFSWQGRVTNDLTKAQLLNDNMDVSYIVGGTKENNYEDGKEVTTPQYGDNITAIRVYASQEITKSVKKKYNIADGVTADVSIVISNTYTDVNIQKVPLNVFYKVGMDVSFSSSVSMEVLKAINFPINDLEMKFYFCNIGYVSFKIDSELEGKCSLNYVEHVELGMEYSNGSFRFIKEFREKEFNISAEASSKLGVKIAVGVGATFLDANIYASLGCQAKTQSETYDDEKKPERCTQTTAWLYAEVGFEASIGTLEYGDNYSIYNEDNSPLRVSFHYEDGVHVARCSRENINTITGNISGGTSLKRRYYTLLNSRTVNRVYDTIKYQEGKINTNEDVIGALSKNDDVVWYEFSNKNNGFLQVSFIGAETPKDAPKYGWNIYLYEDKKAEPIKSWTGIKTLLLSKQMQFSNTTFYLKIVASDKNNAPINDEYVLRIIDTESNHFEMEHNDTEQDANEFTVGEGISGTLYTVNDIDWYKFTTGDKGYSVVTFDKDQSTNNDSIKYGWDVDIYKANYMQSPVDSYSSVKDKIRSIKLLSPNTTYYIKIKSNMNLSGYAPVDSIYNINVIEHTEEIWEVEDNNSINNANELNSDDVMLGILGDKYDQDWFVYEPKKTGYFNVEFNPSDSTIGNIDIYGWNMYIYSEDDKSNPIWKCMDIRDSVVSYKFPYKDKKFYVKISGSKYSTDVLKKTYQISINQIENEKWEIEDNDISAKATEISINDTKNAIMIKSGDIDWFKYTMTKNGTSKITFTPDSTLSDTSIREGWRIDIFAEGNMGTPILSYDKIKSTFTTNELPYTGNTIYIRVKGVGYSPCKVGCRYSISVGGTESDYWERESNNSYTNASVIKFSNKCVINGNLTNSNDVDFYKIHINKEADVNISLSNTYNELLKGGWSMYMYSNNLSSPMAVVKNVVGKDEFKKRLKPGNYYLKVVANTTANAPVGKCYTINVKGNFNHSKYYVVGKKSPTCSTDGYTGDIYCGECNKLITKGKNISATGKHVCKQSIVKASNKGDGKIVKKCSVCKKKISTTVIPRISSVKVTSSFVYDKKKKNPTVQIRKRDGKLLSKSYYKVTCSNNKNVGSGKVKIVLKGNYSGTIYKIFKIVPKKTTISSLVSNKKKTAIIRWVKQAIQTTGYQVQYSTSKEFSSPTTKTVSKSSVVELKLNKLKSGKTYYIRVRTYKKIGNKKYYSAWTGIKNVFVK